jgi:hypothetical protein
VPSRAARFNLLITQEYYGIESVRMGTEQHPSSCPLSGVDRRLDDVHQQWHQAEEAYFDPERFRVAIHTVIQSLRTVSFILQNRKDDIPDFDVWYGGWQERLRGDPLMRWMVDARNKIEKQGDLELHSLVRAEIIASYLNEGPRIEVPARLFDNPERLIQSIPAGELHQHIHNHGTLKIERRWVENTLPDHELLDAVAIAYGRISTLVRDAHRQMGLLQAETTNIETGERLDEGAREGRLPCMIGHSETRALNISLAGRRILRFDRVAKEIHKEDARKAVERYGDIDEDMFGSKGGDEGDIAANLFKSAKKVFLKDGYHESIIFLFRERRLLHLFGIRPENLGQRYLLMRTVADEVIKYGADAIIELGELWLARANMLKPYQRPSEVPERVEALSATLATKSGVTIQFIAKVQRDGDNVVLHDTQVDRKPALFSFAPVYEAWGRPIPDQWLEGRDCKA